MNQEPDYLTAAEVAKRLRLSLRSTYRLLAEGKIVGVRRGERGCWLVTAEAADAYLTVPKGPAATPPPTREAQRRHAEALAGLRESGYAV